MKLYIYDTQISGRYFADRAEFGSGEEIRQQLVSYHSVDAEEPELLEKMSLSEIIEYGQWEIHDEEGNEVNPQDL